MARRRKGRPINGVILLDKPTGISSNDALQKVKRIYFAEKAGHTGLLTHLRRACCLSVLVKLPSSLSFFLTLISVTE
ncbi:tRNA pseudouridine synthase B [Vibrio astriarenae]|nr:tRNA pseudouridine synthase B [Vibrio sp. C7]